MKFHYQHHYNTGDKHLKQELIYPEENDIKNINPDSKLFLTKMPLKQELLDLKQIKQEFSCNFCVKSFKEESSLRRHESIHTG